MTVYVYHLSNFLPEVPHEKTWLVFMLGALVLVPCSLLAQPVAKVAVSGSGAIALNGKRTTLAALDEDFKRLKAQSGVVWYHRENLTSEPHPNATAVVQLVIKYELPVSMSTKPDFSDYVDQTGVSRPRQ